MRIYHKIVFYSIGIIVVPLLLLSGLFYIRIKTVIENEYALTYRHMAQQHIQLIENRAGFHENLLEQIVTNQLLKDILTWQNALDSEMLALGAKLTSQIDALLNKEFQQDIYLISVYSPSTKAPLVTSYIVTSDEVAGESWYFQPPKTAGIMSPVLTETKGLRIACISLMDRITSFDQRNFGQLLGYVKIDLSISEFFSRIFTDLNDDAVGRIVILSGTGKPIYVNPWNSEIDESTLEMIMDYGSTSERIATIRDSGSGLLLVSDLPTLGVKYVLSIPLSGLQGKIFRSGILIVASFLSLVAIFLSLVLMLTQPFTKRLNALVRKINLLRDGNLTTQPSIGGSDEISLVDSHFDGMVVRLRELFHQNYVQKLETRNAQLRELQAQINPHFLYNTLELVNSIASVYDCSEICTICENLGKILRYNLDPGSTSFTSLSNELKNVRNYLSIQEVRYGGDLSVAYDISPESLEVMVPRFILQPIVENAVKHAFRDTKDGMLIIISAYVADQFLRISVEDNGSGMSVVSLIDLRNYIADTQLSNHIIGEDGTSIGLRNVHSRLLLTYGDSCELGIESTQYHGTTVTIRLPTNACAGRSAGV